MMLDGRFWNFDNTIFSHHLTIYFFPCIDTQKIQLTTHHGNSDMEIDEKFILRINSKFVIWFWRL